MSNREKLLYIFVALSSSIFILESFIPRPLPWIKLGLSNVITVLLIYFFPLNFVLKVVVYRVVIGSIFSASLFTPSFFLSFSGGISSAVAMFLAKKFFDKFFSSIGISIIGAETHIFTQLLVVYKFIIKDADIFKLTPYLIIFSLITGLIIGIISLKVIEDFEKFYNEYLSSSL